MRRILMLLLTAVLMIGAAVPDADARGYHRPRRNHRNTRSGRRRNRRARVFSRFGSFTHGIFPNTDLKLTAEQKQVFFKDDRRKTEAYLRELREKERARRRRK